MLISIMLTLLAYVGMLGGIYYRELYKLALNKYTIPLGGIYIGSYIEASINKYTIRISVFCSIYTYNHEYYNSIISASLLAMDATMSCCYNIHE